MSDDNCSICKKEGRVHGHFSHWKDDAVAASGELLGTILFLLFAFLALQTVNTNTPDNGGEAAETGTTLQGSDAARLIGYYYISAGFGLSLCATASIFFRFTGSIFSPSVSLALMLVGVIRPVRFILICIAQMAGGILAALLADAMTPGTLSLNVGLDKGTNRTQGLFLEAFASFILTMAVLMIAAEKHRLTFLAPLFLGFLLFVVEMGTVPFTGGAVNTARAFGPAVVTRNFNSYHWIYWLGPTLGSLVGTGFYAGLKVIKYWHVAFVYVREDELTDRRIAPEQDSDDHRHAPTV